MCCHQRLWPQRCWQPFPSHFFSKRCWWWCWFFVSFRAPRPREVLRNGYWITCDYANIIDVSVKPNNFHSLSKFYFSRENLLALWQGENKMPQGCCNRKLVSTVMHLKDPHQHHHHPHSLSLLPYSMDVLKTNKTHTYCINHDQFSKKTWSNEWFIVEKFLLTILTNL